MGASDTIQSICDTIVAAFHPLRVVLFGSHAAGAATPDSDVDLLVVMPFEGSPIRKAAEISLTIPRSMPIDVLVRTPEFVRERLALGDSFMREIVEKGRVLYDASDRRMCAEG